MVDVSNNATTTARLETVSDGTYMAGTYSGRMETIGDHDWIRVNLVAGQTYSIFVSAQTPGSGAGDATLTLRNSAGASVGTSTDDGPGYNAYLSVLAQTTGTYFLDIGLGFGSLDAYSVAVTSRPGTDIVSATEADETLNAGPSQRVAGGGGDDTITTSPNGYPRRAGR